MGKLKRWLAGFLAIATVLSSSNIAYAAGTNSNENVLPKTLAEAMVFHYEFSEDEAKVLTSDVVKQVALPDTEEPTKELVSIDSVSKKVTATALVDEANGYKWVPKHFVTVENAGTENEKKSEKFNLVTSDGKEYSANYTDAARAFSVRVAYDLMYTVDDNSKQQDVLDIVNILDDTMDYATDLNGLVSQLGTFQTQTEALDDAKAELQTKYDQECMKMKATLQGKIESAVKDEVEAFVESQIEKYPTLASKREEMIATGYDEAIKEFDFTKSFGELVEEFQKKYPNKVAAYQDEIDKYNAEAAAYEEVVKNIEILQADMKDGLDYYNGISAITVYGKKIPFLLSDDSKKISGDENKNLVSLLNAIKGYVEERDPSNSIIGTLRDIVDSLTDFQTRTYLLANAENQNKVFAELETVKAWYNAATDSDAFKAAQEFEELCEALYNTEHLVTKDVEITDPIKVTTTEVTATVDAAMIKVEITATVPVKGIDQFECQTLDPVSDTLVLGVDYNAAAIADAVNAKAAELKEKALAKWKKLGYDVTLESYYNAPINSEMPEKLNVGDELTYTVAYTPVMHTVETNYWSEAKEIAHGNQISLPKYGSNGKFYNYSVIMTDAEGQESSGHYNQGAVISVLGNLEIEQTLVERTVTRFYDILSQKFDKKDEISKTILNSKAIDSPELLLNYPTVDTIKKVDTELTDEGETIHYVTACNVESGVEGMVWVPTNAVLMKTDEKGNAVEVSDIYVMTTYADTLEDGRTARLFSWIPGEVSYDYVQVNYELQITTIIDVNEEYVALNDKELRTYLELPKVLLDEVKEHQRILSGPVNKIYTSIEKDEQLKLVMKTNALSSIAGELHKDFGQKAVTAILKENTGEDLNLYTYLSAVCSTGTVDVAKYLLEEYNVKIRDEAGKLAPNLRLIAEDPNLGNVLGQSGENLESTRQQIRDFASNLDGIYDDGSVQEGTVLTENIMDLSEHFILDKAEPAAFNNLVNAMVSYIDAETKEPLTKITDELVNSGVIITSADTADAPGLGSINITVVGPNGAPVDGKINFPAGEGTESYKFTSDDVAALNFKLNEVMVAAGITSDNPETADVIEGNEKYYNKAVDIALPELDTVFDLTETTAFYYTITYTAKTYTVPVTSGGVEVDTITFTGSDKLQAVFNLPEYEGNGAYIYKYQITEILENGEVFTTDELSVKDLSPYTVKNLAAIAEEKHSLIIERKTWNMETEKLDKIVGALNGALRSQEGLIVDDELAVSFVPILNYETIAANGEYKEIVLRVNATTQMDFKALLPAIGNAMTQIVTETNYIGFGSSETKSAFLAPDEEGIARIKMQALIDMMLGGNISLEGIADMIDENGSIKNHTTTYTVDTEKAYLKEDAELGGAIVTSGIQFGTEGTELPFYMTIAGEQSEYLKGLKSAATAIGKYASVGTTTDENGKSMIAFNAQMPEDAYTVYMSLMLMTGAIKEEELGADESGKPLDPTLQGHIKALKNELLGGFDLSKVNTEIIENTLSKIKGTAVELSEYKEFIDPMINLVNGVLNNLDGVEGEELVIDVTKNEGGQFAFDVIYDIKGIIESDEALSPFAGFLGENTKLTIPMSFTVANISEDVEAIVLDWGKSGISKLQYVDDVAAALANADGATYVYLLQNLEQLEGKDLVVKQDTVLNLNGKTVNREITAETAALRIVDSSLDADNAGMVNGKVSGSNVRIAAGKYTDQKLTVDMLHEGYTQDDDGVVRSEYYTIEEVTVDEDGNELPVKEVNVKLSTELADITKGNMQTLALDMISDVFFNVYNWASISVDDKLLIGADAKDILGGGASLSGIASKLSGCIDRENISEFVNSIYNEFGTIEQIAQKVEDGGEIANFKLTTANWGVKVELMDGENGKYIGINLATDNEETRNVTISFMDKNPELAQSLRELAQILTINHDFQYDGVEFVNGKLDIKGGAKLGVVVDLTKNLENSDEKSSDYVTAIAATLAYSLPAGEQRDQLVAAIVDYENNIYAGALEDAIDALTVEQFINAIKAAKARNEANISFTDMLNELGLRNLLLDAPSVEAAYAPVLEVVYNLVDAADKAINLMQNYTEVYARTLGGVKDVDANGVKTYGGDFNRGEVTIAVRMKLFSENYVPPVDHVIEALEKIPADLRDICETDEDGNVIVGATDHREEYLDIIADARNAYDALSDSLKKYVPEELYDRLVKAEAFYENMGVWIATIDEYNYTGKAIKPVVRVYHGSKLLTLKTDYTVSYKYNTNAATATVGSKAPQVIVKLKKNYSGTIYAYFTIKQIDLAKAYADAEYREEVGLTIDDVYTVSTTSKSKTNMASPTVYLNGKKMSTSDYGLFYPANPTKNKKETVAYKVTGEYPIVVYGKGKNFIANEKDADGNPVGYTVTQHVANKKMSSVTVKMYDSAEAESTKAKTSFGYTGSEINPKLVVTYKTGKKTYNLIEGIHFTTDITNNINVGTATIVLTGTGDVDASEGATNPYSFYGTKKVTFKITTTLDISSSKYAKITMLDDATGLAIKKGKYVEEVFTGYAIELDEGLDYTVTAKDGTVLELDKDFTVSYKNNVNKGTATITFKGMGQYKGTVKKSFKITAAPITNLLVSDPEIEVTYKKGGVKPSSEIILRNANTLATLKNGKDYTLTWSNTTRVATLNAETGEYEYVNVKTKNLPKVVIKGKGNYKDSITLYYTITPAVLAEQATLTANDVKLSTSKSNNYKTSFTLKDSNGKSLTSKTDYSTKYQYYVWENGEWVLIDSAKLKDTTRFGSKGKIKFVSDAEKTDGIRMKLVVTGASRYKGTIEDEYRIYQTSISSAKVSKIASVNYDKFAQEPAVKVTYKGKTLVQGEDYEITSASYTKNIFVGTATVTIKGINNFGGTVKKTFLINAYKQSKIAMSAVAISFKAEGNDLEMRDELITGYKKGGSKPNKLIVLTYTNPATGKTVTLVEGRDYKLTWLNTTRVADENGNYSVSLSKQPKVKITGTGNYTGSKTVYYTIMKSTLAMDGVTMATKNVKYENKNSNYKTSVTVKDVNGKKLTSGTDYKVTEYYIYIHQVADTTGTAQLVKAYRPIKEVLGKTIILENGAEVDITAKGNVKLAKGETIQMKVEVTGIKNYEDVYTADDVESKISAEYTLYRK